MLSEERIIQKWNILAFVMRSCYAFPFYNTLRRRIRTICYHGQSFWHISIFLDQKSRNMHYGGECLESVGLFLFQVKMSKILTMVINYRLNKDKFEILEISFYPFLASEPTPHSSCCLPSHALKLPSRQARRGQGYGLLPPIQFVLFIFQPQSSVLHETLQICSWLLSITSAAGCPVWWPPCWPHPPALCDRALSPPPGRHSSRWWLSSLQTHYTWW